MKNLLLLALLSTLPAQAIELKDLRGSWTGTHSETTKGKGYKFKASFTGSKRSDGGLVLKENVPDADAKATYTFEKGGKFKSVLIQGDFYVVSTYSGTWKLSRGVITVTGKGTDGKLSVAIKDTKNGFQVNGTFGKSKVDILGKRK
ncbi:MAG: hypothetical protein EOP87_11370 [Verrucomicrobiaceae bacterium]|nr:MAG: hypothetical protein EOP87_11370 [Verrucomicrobiaceae bacterium]